MVSIENTVSLNPSLYDLELIQRKVNTEESSFCLCSFCFGDFRADCKFCKCSDHMTRYGIRSLFLLLS